MRALWLTDLHVNRLDQEQYNQLLNRIKISDAEAIWLTGDIGDPPLNWTFLEDLFCIFNKPIYFVLGNHDYYHQQVDATRQKARDFSQSYPNAYYLATEAGFVWEEQFILGVGGWANTGNIPIKEKTWDSDAIDDLLRLNNFQLQTKLNELAESDAQTLLLKCAAGITDKIKKVTIFTHVPPTDAMHGKYSIKPLQDNRTIYYSSALSAAFKSLLQDYPDIEFQVYSGHLHQSQVYKINDRLTGYVAKAYAPNQPLNWITL